MGNKYPEYIMAILRQRLNLEPTDTSRDTEINLYTPNEAFEEVLNWEGFIGWAGTIKTWIDSIYGINLNDVENENDYEDYDEEEFDDSAAWEDDSDRGCKDCPPDECTGHCMSCYYRPV